MQREDLLADLSEARLPQGKVRSDGKETDRRMEAKIGFEHTGVFLCLMPRSLTYRAPEPFVSSLGQKVHMLLADLNATFCFPPHKLLFHCGLDPS